MIRVLMVVLAFLAPAGSAAAQSDDIESVIGAQLDAFGRDDFAEAFTYASPMIKRLFGSPERFGQMVRNGYPMVWRPSEVVFGGAKAVGASQVKTVFFTDQSGRRFEAAYEMIETENGWQINGVSIREADIGV